MSNRPTGFPWACLILSEAYTPRSAPSPNESNPDKCLGTVMEDDAPIGSVQPAFCDPPL
jgi:hypothetical protein